MSDDEPEQVNTKRFEGKESTELGADLSELLNKEDEDD